MALIKGSKQKFKKQRTDISTPSIVQPITTSAGISLQGSADVDQFNPETFYFHIVGAVPSKTLLYIFGDLFDQNYYTEVGEHDHGPGNFATGNVTGGNTSHNHGISVNSANLGNKSFTTNSDSHEHRIMIETDPFQANDNGIDTINFGSGDVGYDRFINGTAPGSTWIESDSHSHSGSVNIGNHSHNANANNTSINSHSHTVSSGSSAVMGIVPSGTTVRNTGSNPKTYFDSLLIEIDGVDRTAPLLAQAAQAKFGDGTSGDVIVTAGIELDISNFVTTPGQHKIKFSVAGATDNGGKVRYNLYTFV